MTFNHFGEYKCICGKVFTNSQAFNGHKFHCREHQINKYGEDAYINKLQIQKDRQQLAVNAKKEKNTTLKNKQILKWISEEHRCEYCGKVMTQKYGSGRFCCEKCARAYASAFSNHNQTNKSKTKAAKPKPFNCIICGKPIGKTKHNLCVNCLHHTDVGKQILSEINRTN